MSEVALHLITLKLGKGGAKYQYLSDVGPCNVSSIS